MGKIADKGLEKLLMKHGAKWDFNGEFWVVSKRQVRAFGKEARDYGQKQVQDGCWQQCENLGKMNAGIIVGDYAIMPKKPSRWQRLTAFFIHSLFERCPSCLRNLGKEGKLPRNFKEAQK